MNSNEKPTCRNLMTDSGFSGFINNLALSCGDIGTVTLTAFGNLRSRRRYTIFLLHIPYAVTHANDYKFSVTSKNQGLYICEYYKLFCWTLWTGCHNHQPLGTSKGTIPYSTVITGTCGLMLGYWRSIFSNTCISPGINTLIYQSLEGLTNDIKIWTTSRHLLGAFPVRISKYCE